MLISTVKPGMFLYTVYQSQQETDLSDDYTELQSYEEVVSNHCRGPISKEYWEEIQNFVTELIQSLGMHWGLSIEKKKGRTRPKLDNVLSEQLAYTSDPQSSKQNRIGKGIKASRLLKYTKKVMKAYLECVLRVPPFLMSADGLQLMLHTGLSLSEHPLGRLITVFVLIFRSIFYNAAKHAFLVLAKDDIDSSVTWSSESDDLLSDTTNTTGCTVSVIICGSACCLIIFSCTPPH